MGNITQKQPKDDSKELPPERFSEMLKTMGKDKLSDDPFKKAITAKEDDESSPAYFKRDLVEKLSTHPGAVAFAVKMCGPEFKKFVEEALAERNKKGYNEVFDYLLLMDPISTLNNFLSAEDKTPLPNPSKGIKRDKVIFPELENPEKITYAKLLETAESSLEVRNMRAALDRLFAEYPDRFRNMMSVMSHHANIFEEEPAMFVNSFLKIAKKKHLYEGEFKFADIGTSSGEFSKDFVSYIQKNFKKSKIVRTNPTDLEILHHAELGVRMQDITQSSLGDESNMLIIKDVMKFFDEPAKAGIWKNVRESVTEGGVVISGSTWPHIYAYKQHVMHNNELVKVDGEKFLKELEKVRDYRDYLSNLDGILERSRNKA